MSVVLPIQPDTRFREYTASAGQTQFPIAFPFQQNRDVKALLKSGQNWQEIDDTLYEIAGAGDPEGGTLTMLSGRQNNDVVGICGAAILDRLSSVVRDGRFNSKLTDDEFDRNRIIQQEQQRDIGRSIKVNFGTAPLTLIGPIDSGHVLSVDGNTILQGPSIEQIAAAEGFAESANSDAERATAAADRAEAGADITNYSWALIGSGVGTGDVADYPLSFDPGSPNNMLVNVGGSIQLYSQGAFSLVYTGSSPFFRANITYGVAFEVRASRAVTPITPNDLSVSTQKMLDSAVTLVKLAANSVDGSKIIDGSVGTTELADSSVTVDKVAAGAQVGFASVANSANTTLNTTFAAADTVPTGAEGTVVLTLNYTPKKIGNILLIEFAGKVGSTPANLMSWGIFDGLTCLKADSVSIVASGFSNTVGFVVVPVAALTAKSFTLRMGPNNGGGSTPIAINGLPSSPFTFGGKGGICMTLREIKA